MNLPNKKNREPIPRPTVLLLLTALLLPFFITTARAETEFPLIQAFAYYPYNDHRTLKKGTMSASIQLDYANVYQFDHLRAGINDFEVLSTVMGFRYGLGRGWTADLYLRHTALTGGGLDKFIEDFHRLFNLPDNNRQAYPRNRVIYKYKDRFLYQSGQGAMTHLTAAVQKELVKSPAWTVHGLAALGLPLSSAPGLSSGQPFITVGLKTSYQRNWFSAEISGYYTKLFVPSWLKGETLHNNMAVAQLELRAFGFIGGLSLRTSPFKSGDLAHNGYQGYLGFRIFRKLEFLIREDFATFDTTPDIQFSLRYKLL